MSSIEATQRLPKSTPSKAANIPWALGTWALALASEAAGRSALVFDAKQQAVALSYAFRQPEAWKGSAIRDAALPAKTKVPTPFPPSGRGETRRVELSMPRNRGGTVEISPNDPEIAALILEGAQTGIRSEPRVPRVLGEAEVGT